ncbi:Verruculogen synthase [Elasticomyces elasticus]|nr:Verruculogen synthase [Elasticomyces elasticus]
MPTATTIPRFRAVHVSEGAQRIFDVMQEDGCVCINLNTDIDPAIAKLSAGSKHEDAWIAGFHGSNTKRLTNLATLSRAFREDILDADVLHGVCEKVFSKDSGTFWMNTAQVIEIGPGNKAQGLHRDNMQYPVFTGLGPNGPEACINFFLAMTEFTDENGATRVIPGSHKWDDFNQKGNEEDTIPAEMSAGDCFLFSGKLLHGGGANQTPDFFRRGIALSMQASYLTPEEAYPFLIDLQTVKTMTPRAQALVAFRSQFPKDSPGLWQSDYTELGDLLGLT